MELLTLDRDFRLGAYCASVKVQYSWYLERTTGAEKNLAIQRGIIRGQRSYQTLRADLKRGCILPPIVLASSLLQLPPKFSFFDADTAFSYTDDEISQIARSLSSIEPNQSHIIDGLQRTNAMRESLEEIHEEEAKIEFLARFLRLEIWLNISFNALAYRMLLLNAGQRPMSMKHQIEILSLSLKDDLEDIDGIEIITGFERRRRVSPGQFRLEDLASAFQAWLQGQPNIDLRNAVVEQLLGDAAVETLGNDLSLAAQPDGGHGFKLLVNYLVTLDISLGRDQLAFLSNETVVQGIAAAVGAAQKNPENAARIQPAFGKLLRELNDDPEMDPIGAVLFDQLRSGINVKRVNVGEATRNAVFHSFQEYIRASGEKKMSDCWAYGFTM